MENAETGTQQEKIVVDETTGTSASEEEAREFLHKNLSRENFRRTKPKEPPKKKKELKFSENALRVLERRYLKKDENSQICERPEDMFRRVAHNIASADKLYDPQSDISKTEELFYNLMMNLEFIPNSPTLMNAGRDLQQLSACFVLPIEDSMEEIFDTVKNTALIHKSGGGTGFSFSRLRPKNSPVRSTRGASSGPVSFMSVFNSATEIIKQGGTRRGANMGILRVDHPDIIEFITCKEQETNMTNFNISVALTNAFMEAVEKDMDYDIVDPRTKERVDSLRAKKVFNLIVEMAHRNGEPGIIFIDRINNDNPTPLIGAIESTNPCGEQPLLPYESCNLGSVNLARLVSDGEVNYERLARVVHTSIRFLDNVIDMNRYPLEKIEKMTKGNRKVGLGVMGFADMLVQMKIPYDSEEAISLGEKVMKFIQDEARKESIRLAEKRGTFPSFNGSIHDVPNGLRLRNATVTTIAPTGTISIIAGSSSGIEPYFAVSYVRNVMDNDELVEVNPYFEKAARDGGFYSEELMRKIARKGCIQGLKEIPKDVRRLFVTAHDISPEWHIRMQGAFQKYVDNAVSKTVNFSNSATTDDVAKAYMLAYQLGCKGVTIYRDGSRSRQVLEVKKDKNEKAEAVAARPAPRKRPALTKGATERVITGCGHLYVTVNEDEQGMCELFTQMGKSGGCAAAQSEAISRLISLCLRSGVGTDQIVKHLRGIRCHSPSWQNGGQILSCPDAVGIVIDRHLKAYSKGMTTLTPEENHEMLGQSEDSLDHLVGACPDCGGVVEHESGCVVCRLCGFTRCS